jgi:hypothetical protein
MPILSAQYVWNLVWTYQVREFPTRYAVIHTDVDYSDPKAKSGKTDVQGDVYILAAAMQIRA